MTDLFSDEMRRNPYAMYDQLRSTSPAFAVPQTGLRMLFDCEGAKRVLTEFHGRVKSFKLASTEPWTPRKGLHVHGLERLPIESEAAKR
jgi:hypothetical protein